MPYAPGIEYRGDRYLYQGITSGAQGLTSNVKDYIDRGKKSKALDPLILAYAGDDEEKQKTLKAALPGMSLEQKEGMVQAGVLRQAQAKQQQDAELKKAKIARYLADTARVNAAMELDKEHNLRTQDAEEQNAIFNRSLGEGLSNPGQPTSSQLQSYYESSSSEQPDLPPAPTNPWMAFGAALQAAPRTTEAAKAIPNLIHYAGQQRGSPALEFKEDPVTGVRFALYGNQLMPSGANLQGYDTTAEPVVDKDGNPTGQAIVRGPKGRTIIKLPTTPPDKETTKTDASGNVLEKTTTTHTKAGEKAAVKEVERITKDGRRAVFDADTKKFLRYAD